MALHMWVVGSGVHDPLGKHTAVNTSVGRNPSLQLNCSTEPSSVELLIAMMLLLLTASLRGDPQSAECVYVCACMCES